MPIMNTGIKTKTVAVGLLETPNITLEDVPDSLNPGDEVKPKVTVKRADATTPIPGMKVTFFVKDSHGTLLLGTTRTTDTNGQAVADQSYFVSDMEQGANVIFSVVTWPKVV